jgi:hypothetical protein
MKVVVHPLGGWWTRKRDGAKIEVYGGKAGSVFWRGMTADAGRVDCHTFMQEHTPNDVLTVSGGREKTNDS